MRLNYISFEGIETFMGVIGKYEKIKESGKRAPPCTKVGFSVYFEDRSGKKEAIMVK
jgi:hypothetical protein